MTPTVRAILAALTEDPTPETTTRAREIACLHSARPELATIAAATALGLRVQMDAAAAGKLAASSRLTGILNPWGSLALVTNSSIGAAGGFVTFLRPQPGRGPSFPGAAINPATGLTDRTENQGESRDIPADLETTEDPAP